MFIFYVLTFTLVAVISSADAINYCNPDLCSPDRKPHVGCDASDRFGPICGNNPKEIKMDSKWQTLILNKHNQLRSDIAEGRYNFPQAKKMATLTWDQELAKLAFYNARKCQFAHDRCRNTEKFKYAGQNIAITSYSGYNFTPENRTEFFIQEWFNEYKDCPATVINSYPMSWRGPMIGHFTQIVSDRSWKVGCSLVYWTTGTSRKTENYYFVCNYSMTNIIREPVYVAGNTASGCKRRNSRFPGLCHENEDIQSEPYNG